MDEKKKKILEFVDRSLILSVEIKQRVIDEIDSLAVEQIDNLWKILFSIDQQQTKILSKKLEEEPWFFMKLQWTVSRASYQEHLKEELSELSELEEKFDEMLKEI